MYIYIYVYIYIYIYLRSACTDRPKRWFSCANVSKNGQFLRDSAFFVILYHVIMDRSSRRRAQTGQLQKQKAIWLYDLFTYITLICNDPVIGHFSFCFLLCNLLSLRWSTPLTPKKVELNTNQWGRLKVGDKNATFLKTLRFVRQALLHLQERVLSLRHALPEGLYLCQWLQSAAPGRKSFFFIEAFEAWSQSFPNVVNLAACFKFFFVGFPFFGSENTQWPREELMMGVCLHLCAKR